MNGLTQLIVKPLLQKRCMLHLKCSALFCSCYLYLGIVNQAALEKSPVTIESIVFSFSVNCSFKNTFSF